MTSRHTCRGPFTTRGTRSTRFKTWGIYIPFWRVWGLELQCWSLPPKKFKDAAACPPPWALTTKRPKRRWRNGLATLSAKVAPGPDLIWDRCAPRQSRLHWSPLRKGPTFATDLTNHLQLTKWTLLWPLRRLSSELLCPAGPPGDLARAEFHESQPVCCPKRLLTFCL